MDRWAKLFVMVALLFVAVAAIMVLVGIYVIKPTVNYSPGFGYGMMYYGYWYFVMPIMAALAIIFVFLFFYLIKPFLKYYALLCISFLQSLALSIVT